MENYTCKERARLGVLAMLVPSNERVEARSHPGMHATGLINIWIALQKSVNCCYSTRLSLKVL